MSETASLRERKSETGSSRRQESGTAVASVPLMVTGRSAGDLTEEIRRTVAQLSTTPPDDFRELAYASCVRTPHPHRAVAIARSADDAVQQLTKLITDDAHAGVRRTTAAPLGVGCVYGTSCAVRGSAVPNGNIALIFNGDGNQWAGMGADLFRREEVFRAAVEEVDAELAPRQGWSVCDYLTLPPEEWQLDTALITQPLTFAFQVALVAVLRDRGFHPALVLGRSLGEAAAAHTAGALTTAQSALLVTAASRLLAQTAGSGKMMAVGLGETDAEQVLQAYSGRLELAAVNSPQHVTVAGDAAALDELGRSLARRGVAHRELALNSAFHSSAMEPLRGRFMDAVGDDLAPRRTRIPFYSSFTGACQDGRALTAAYWWGNIRHPVKFSHAVQAALTAGADILLQVGPHPDQGTYLRRIAAAQRPRMRAAVLAACHRDTDGLSEIMAAQAALLVVGAEPDWDLCFRRP
ncbi:acyltransferase domain-containing protein [Streptomyces sp. NPDC096205]|uniref:acyltransferase domain-containing protein n=1 Tax=Streptomyces sp. NPDC096205 TaxID=3366081 RepID=UPI003808C5AE